MATRQQRISRLFHSSLCFEGGGGGGTSQYRFYSKFLFHALDRHRSLLQETTAEKEQRERKREVNYEA